MLDSPNPPKNNNNNNHKKINKIAILELFGLSKIVDKITAAPFDRTQTLLQVQGELVRSGRLEKGYEGIVDCLTRTLKNEGPLSFWRGQFPNIIQSIPAHAIQLYVFAKVRNSSAADSSAEKVKSIFAAATVAAVFTTIMYPLHYAHVRLAADVGNKTTRRFRGTRDVITRTVLKDGPRGVFRGIGPGLFSNGVYNAACFVVFNIFKQIIPIGKDKTSQVLFASAIIVTAGTMAYPLRTVQSYMIMRSMSDVPLRNSVHAFREIIKTDGIRALWRGGATDIAKGVYGSIVMFAYAKITNW